MKTAHIKLPATTEDLQKLECGMAVTLDGVIYTGREGLYRRIIDEGQTPPADLASISNVNFHCSPAARVNPDGSHTIGAVTATASFRFSKWLTRWFEIAQTKIIIGKGGMSPEDYRTYFVPNQAIYLTTVGYGTGALLGRGIKRIRNVFWLDELGIAQAMWVLEVENFGPFLVDSDLAGNSLFEQQNNLVNQGIDKLYEGLRSPALRRYGEERDKTQEVI